jgi:hypothetical protein
MLKDRHDRTMPGVALWYPYFVVSIHKRRSGMASIDDYTSGRVLQQAAQALSMLKAGDDSLEGTDLGNLLLAEVSKLAPRLIGMADAEQLIRSAEQCAVGPRVCYANNPDAEFTESVLLDKLADGMVAAGKARMVSPQEALHTLAKYKKNPLVLSTVSGKPMEICRSSCETCICWNMEKRGLKCLDRNISS